MKIRAFAAALLLTPLLCGCFYGNTTMLGDFKGEGLCPFESGVTYAGYSRDKESDTPLGTFTFEDESGTCSLREARGVTSAGSSQLAKFMRATNKLIGDGHYVSYQSGAGNSEGYTEFSIVTRYDDKFIEVRETCKKDDDSFFNVPGIRSNEDDCYVDTEGQLRRLAEQSKPAKVVYYFEPVK